jgi:hypothetical protein
LNSDPSKGLSTLRRYAGAAGGLALGTVSTLVIKDHIPENWIEVLSLQKPEHFQLLGALVGTVIGSVIRDVGVFLGRCLSGIGELFNDAARWVGRQIDKLWEGRERRRELRLYLKDLKELYDTKLIDEKTHKEYVRAAMKQYHAQMSLPRMPPRPIADTAQSNQKVG